MKTDELCQFIENLADLLPERYPNLYIRSNGKFYRLIGENKTELLIIFEALIEAIFHVDVKPIQ
jgi:hypothetical protein